MMYSTFLTVKAAKYFPNLETDCRIKVVFRVRPLTNPAEASLLGLH